MATIVTSAATFQTALASAQPGDTIALAPGTYAGLSIVGRTFAQDVTITSQSLDAPAVLTNLNVSGSRGLTFSKLEFVTDRADNPFRVVGSQDVHFEGLNVHGSLDGNPRNDTSALLVQNSSDVSVAGSEFQQLANGISHFDVQGLALRNNSFHDIRTDAIHGGGSSNVVIADNSFRDFYPVAGDHPDAIQFWTVNTKTAVHDITITGNKFIRGAGEAVQGIFFNDEVGGLAPQHVTIAGNLLAGAMYHGISLLGGADVTIRNNVVQGFTDMKSWILLKNVNGAAVSNNYANEYVDWGGVTGSVSTQNKVLPLASDGGAAALALWNPETASGGERLVGSVAADTIDGGAGPDTISDPGGSNYLRGGDGADSIGGGGGFDDINGNAGEDTVSGGLGDDWVVGGKDADSLAGGAGADLVYGNLGGDTCEGGDGDDVVRGGKGDDVARGGAGADFISGDLGSDTLSGSGGADVFHSFGDAGVDRVVDFNLAEGDRVQLDPGTTYSVAQAGADTVISMAGGGQVILAGVSMSGLTPGWIFGA